MSHKDLGWEKFTDVIIEKLSSKKDVIFVLWGNYAKTKKPLIFNGLNFGVVYVSIFLSLYFNE